MQLNEILEENSIKTISQKTKISEANLEAIFAGKFDMLQKTKALGFIAILEREYHADLNTLREDALEYYSANRESSVHETRRYLDEEKKGKSKFLIFVVFGLLVYASWYFFTQFDKKNLSGLIPFVDEKTIENFIGDQDDSTDAATDLSIAKVNIEDEAVSSGKKEQEEVSSHDVSALAAGLVDENDTAETVNAPENVSIVPVRKLWFGLVNIESKEREHFSIDKAYVLDTGEKGLLLATSSAPFSLLQGDTTQAFNDNKEHYFKIDRNGVVILDKSDYIKQGGWQQW